MRNPKSHHHDYIDEDGFWCCGDCKGRGMSRRESRFYSVKCPCGKQPLPHYLDFTPAFCCALKLAQTNQIDFIDGCRFCSKPNSIHQLAVCNNCGTESCYGHKVNAISLLNSPNQNIDNDTKQRLQRNPRTKALFYQPSKS